MSPIGGASPAEQHLGDRLAALVDGELGHDARERVLAHLATCGRCKAEADAQRRLKSVFAQTAPPGPSEGLLARLQGLPGGDPDGPGGGLGPFGRAEFDRDGGGFGYQPSSGAHTGELRAPRQRGFRIHESERPAAPRRRFAFAAAGAVSLAALALGGTLPLEAAIDPAGRQDGTGTAVVPLSATPVAGSDPLRDAGLLTSGGVTGPVAPATPGATGLYGPSAPPPASPPARIPSGGRFGPLIAPPDQDGAGRPTPLTAGTSRAPGPYTPVAGELRPLVGSAVSPTPAFHPPAAAPR
ncbi:zf-HC2 domain-containing protein [Streptomyces sp. NPDC014733]|uniref:zf-HC2 domain-containing protein n=1 Tax=Streptomyces sp. NPDC014733 TaxID=3364885 RepID=UPI0036FC3B1E